MNNSTIREDILYTISGEVQSPIDTNFILMAIKVILAFFGLPLNIFLGVIIARLRRLHSKPRNIFLLGILISNLIVFFPTVIEVLYWINPDVIICKAYVSIIGLPHIILLWNILCALVDRYIAITYPMWHRKKVTVRGAAWFLVASSASFVFFMKLVYIFEIVPFKCEIRILHGKIVGSTVATLFVACIIVHLIVYRRTRALLSESRTIGPGNRRTLTTTNVDDGPPPNPNNPSTVPRQGLSTDGNNPGLRDSDPNPIPPVENQLNGCELNRHQGLHSSSHMFIHMPNGTLSKMEMWATKTLIEGVTSLFVFSSPLIILFFIIFFCHLLMEPECSSYSFLPGPYVKEFALVHAVYNPIIYLFRNEELWSVLKSKFNNLSSGQ